MWRTGIAIDFVVGTIDDTMMHHDHEDAMSDESNDSTYDTEIMHHHIPSRNLSDQLCHSGIIIMPLSTFSSFNDTVDLIFAITENTCTVVLNILHFYSGVFIGFSIGRCLISFFVETIMPLH